MRVFDYKKWVNSSSKDENGRKITEEKVPVIGAPTDFEGKSVWITFDRLPEKGRLRLVVDPRMRINEIFKENNEIEIE